MDIRINSMSEYIHEWLASHSAGYVHSVYKKTINIISDGQMLSLQSSGSPLSPISLIMDMDEDATAALLCAQGDKCIINYNSVTILCAGTEITVHTDTETSIYDPFLPAKSDSDDSVEISAYISLLSGMISRSQKGGFGKIMSGKNYRNDLILAAASEHITNSVAAINAENWQNASDELTALIGLGTGLTPSGDDFLCGVLAGLRHFLPKDVLLTPVLKEEISASLEKTNDISAAFLNCALKNMYSKAVIDLFSISDASSGLDSEKSFLAIGHSSGIDTLCGILHILRIIKHILNK